MYGEGFKGEYYEPTNDSPNYEFQDYYQRSFNEAERELRYYTNNSYDQEFFNKSWQYFETSLIRDKKIVIKKKPKSFLGWFSKESTVKDDIKYTYEQYKETIRDQVVRDMENERTWPEDDEYEDPFSREQKYSRLNFSRFLKIPKYKKFFEELRKLLPEYFDYEGDEENPIIFLGDNFYSYIEKIFGPKYPPEKYYDKLIEFTREKYNEKKDKYNLKIKNPIKYYITDEEDFKELEEEGKKLDDILAFLKPHVQEYDARRGKIPEEYAQKILDYEKRIVLAKEKYEENISKISMLKAKNRMKNDSLFKKIKLLKTQKTELEEKISKIKSETLGKQDKTKSILQSKRQKLQNQINDLQKNIDKNNLDLKKIEDYKNFDFLQKSEQEKILRENELEKLKKLNETSLREKNAILRSLEFEKIKEENRLREEERFQQEKLQKEELKNAKIVFLKEKKIAQKKFKELDVKTKMLSDKKINIQKKESDISTQKEKIKLLLSQKESKLKEKNVEIEQKKLKTLEIEKQNLANKQEYAEQQKLFQDSLSLDISELEIQKKILADSSAENKKFLENTKKQISLLSEEKEKLIRLNMENEKLLKSRQDIQETYFRKKEVFDFLQDSIESVLEKEMAENLAIQKDFQDQIALKKNLSAHLDSKTERLKILTEKKQNYIQKLKSDLSSKVQQIYETREKAIESEMKKILVESSDDLKNTKLTYEYEIGILNSSLSMQERIEDLGKFQLDAIKKELKLRAQELELLKNLNFKSIYTERKNRETDAREAIKDIVQKIEAEGVKEDVREKLDEILDDVENEAVTKDVREKVSSILDAVENVEIKDSAQEKLTFILDKIEIHENVEDSRKALTSILNKIEDKQIREDVEEKLDEILDDVEDEDFDFLEEEDEFDSFLFSVRKHLSGEKKMEQFSKIPEIVAEERKVDSKLKMEERIEMKERGQRIGPEDYEVGETSFGDYDYNLFVNSIENPEMRNKVRLVLHGQRGWI